MSSEPKRTTASMLSAAAGLDPVGVGVEIEPEGELIQGERGARRHRRWT